MPYNYHESTRLSQQNKLALQSLAATGELPSNHYWNALRARYDANPTRIERANVVLGTLLSRDQLQRQGILSASSPLFTRTGFFAFAGDKHDLNLIRFDHYHPFLGRLFEITLPNNPAGQGLEPPPTTPVPPIVTVPPVVTNPPVTNPPTNPDPPILLPPGGVGDGGTPIVNPPVPTPNIVPEPASALLMSLAMSALLVVIFFKKRVERRAGSARPSPVMA